MQLTRKQVGMGGLGVFLFLALVTGIVLLVGYFGFGWFQGDSSPSGPAPGPAPVPAPAPAPDNTPVCICPPGYTPQGQLCVPSDTTLSPIPALCRCPPGMHYDGSSTCKPSIQPFIQPQFQFPQSACLPPSTLQYVEPATGSAGVAQPVNLGVGTYPFSPGMMNGVLSPPIQATFTGPNGNTAMRQEFASGYYGIARISACDQKNYTLSPATPADFDTVVITIPQFQDFQPDINQVGQAIPIPATFTPGQPLTLGGK